jgi:transcriptional antiterminator NusG
MSEPTVETKQEKEPEMGWFVLKVMAGREEQVKQSILRRAKVRGLEHCFGEMIIPTEKVTEVRGGKKRVTEQKLYSGYLIVQMVLNDQTWFLVRETPGVGDFLGAAPSQKPLPMTEREVEKMLGQVRVRTEEGPRLKVDFEKGDTVKIKEGPFENFQGVVDEVLQEKGTVRVMVEIFGRKTPVEIDYWAVERV